MKRFGRQIFPQRPPPSAERAREIDHLNRKLIACPACDAVWQRPQLAPKEIAKCKRCHTTILTNKNRSAERTVAFMVASLVLYVVAISFPFMRMERSGLSNEISVIDAVAILANNSMVILALICAGLILLFPLLRIILLLFVGLSLFRKQSTARPHALSLRLAQMLEPWTMAEIFMIGVIVSLVKVGKLADIHLGPAFWGMAALIVTMAFGASAVCRDTIWHDIRRVS
ncbi:MAG: paraquat-inducible protein A [Pseudomonadota bacterium]